MSPVLLTDDCNDSKYITDQLTYFFDRYSYQLADNLSVEDKKRFFKLLTDNEPLILKLFGLGLKDSIVFLPQALRDGINTPLIREYKTWLEKK